MDIKGQAAVVTGGASGLGMATARALIGKGARVALLDLPGERLDNAAKELGALGVGCDVGSAEAAERAVAEARAANGPMRLLVNCAGIAPGKRIVGRDGGPMPLADFETAIRVNLIGTFNLLRLAAAEMAALEPDAEGEGPDHEPQRRVELDGLAVDASVHGSGGCHLELPRRPRPPCGSSRGRTSRP